MGGRLAAVAEAERKRLVPAAPPTGLFELARAGVAEEVVAGVDVVDAEAIGTGEALADVALQQVVVVHDVLAAAVLEAARGHGLTARLAADERLHGGLVEKSYRAPKRGGANRGTIAQVPHGAVRGSEQPLQARSANPNAIMPGRWGRTRSDNPRRRSHAK